MKVFTVGLDQKASMEKQSEPPSEVVSVAPGTPPPIYPSDALRKKKPYKGILLCMLGVFLLLLFVVTLSEMAYNRERDQNFLRLRWAELKNRMGYYDNYQNNPIHDRLSAHRIRPVESFSQMEATNPPTTTTEKTTTKAAEPEVANDDEPSNLDARLGFLRSILSKIKERAEEMGMDGTMQVSVIQVEPEGMMGQNSDAFKDGFGEGHQPSFFQSNDAAEHEERPMMFGPWASENYPNKFEGPDMFHPQSRFGLGGNQEWNRPNHPFVMGSQEFEERGRPMGQFIGEAYGRRFGRFLQELLARRMNNFQDMTPINDNMPYDPRNGQQFFWPGWQQQQEQQPQPWMWNQQPPMPQMQQWWPQPQQQQQPQPQQFWGFENQQPQRAQNHPEQQQLPPMITLPQENQWGQQQQQIPQIPQIPQQQAQGFQGNQIFQQQPQAQFQMFPQQIFAQQQQQQPQQAQQPDPMQNQFGRHNQQPQQNIFQHIPFVNPAENIQIDPPQQQKPSMEDWKPWGQEGRAWTHQNADQAIPKVHPESNSWQISQSQPALEPSSEFDFNPTQDFNPQPVDSFEPVVPTVATDNDELTISRDVEPSPMTDSLLNQLNENRIDGGDMHITAPDVGENDEILFTTPKESESVDSDSLLSKIPELQAPFEASDSVDSAPVSDPSSSGMNDDAPKDPQIDFPAVKFPVNDPSMDQRIDPRFFQIDEPQPIQSESSI